MGFVYVLSHLILVAQAVILSIVSLSLITGTGTRLHLICTSSNLIDCVSLSMNNPFASEGPDWVD
jgi:hypothetical protein